MRRGHALFLSALLLLGQIAGLAHLLLVTHVTCPEHGDLIHPRKGEAVARAERAQGGAWYPMPSGLGGEDGDHCAGALHQGERLTAPRPPLSVVAPAAHGTLPCPDDLATRTTPSALFRLAPKTSPPLAA